jgi:hypothetical protein
VRDGAAPLIRDNRFLDIDGSAVVFDEGGGGVLESNRIRRTANSAVKVRAGADPTVRGNEIAESGQAGLLIEQGAKGQFAENQIVAPQASGIEVRGGGQEAELEQNELDDNRTPQVRRIAQ